jgi:hypothetical protein
LAIFIHGSAAASKGGEWVSCLFFSGERLGQGKCFSLTQGRTGRFFLAAAILFLLLQEFVDAAAEYFAGYGFELFNNLGFVFHFLSILFGQAGSHSQFDPARVAPFFLDNFVDFC